MYVPINEDNCAQLKTRLHQEDIELKENKSWFRSQFGLQISELLFIFTYTSGDISFIQDNSVSPLYFESSPLVGVSDIHVITYFRNFRTNFNSRQVLKQETLPPQNSNIIN